MAITINGTTNTITGLAVGGIPDGTVDTDALAANAVTTAKIADEWSSSAVTIGGLRIAHGSFTLPDSSSSSSNTLGYHCVYYINHDESNAYSGFASAPMVTVEIDSGCHETRTGNVYTIGTTGFSCTAGSARTACLHGKTVRWLAVGEAS